MAPITDPAWTPLFLPSAAVVVDVGALMSHAVIVSRELGIPCVVSVEAPPDGSQTGPWSRWTAPPERSPCSTDPEEPDRQPVTPIGQDTPVPPRPQ